MKTILTMLRSDLYALARDRRDTLKCIRAQMSLVHTNTMNIILKPNPITVITKFIPEDIIFTLSWCCCLLYQNPNSAFLFVSSSLVHFLCAYILLLFWMSHNCKSQKISNLALFITAKRTPSNNLCIKTLQKLKKTASLNHYCKLFSFSHSKISYIYYVSPLKIFYLAFIPIAPSSSLSLSAYAYKCPGVYKETCVVETLHLKKRLIVVVGENPWWNWVEPKSKEPHVEKCKQKNKDK